MRGIEVRPEDRPLRFNLAARLTLFGTGLVCLSVGVCAILVHRQARIDLERSLGAELLGITLSSAALIDGDVVERVRRTDGGRIAFAEGFDVLREQLARLRAQNGFSGERSLSIVRRQRGFATSGLLELVVMPDADGSGRTGVGDLLPARRHHRRALEGVATASGVYRDSGETWISAAAPLRDSKGRIVGILQADRSAALFEARARAQALRIGWGAFLAVTLGGALSVLFARSLVRPLRRIGDRARALSRGKPHRFLSIRRRDEVGDLAQHFDDMAVSLEQRQRDLERAREEAETSARAMIASERLASVGEFAAGMAHELDDPLASVRSNLEMLAGHWEEMSKELRPDAFAGHPVDVAGEGIELVAQCLEGLDRAEIILRDVCSVAGTAGGRQGPVDLNALCERALRIASPRLGPRSQVECVYGEVPAVHCAPEQIEQVLLNLIRNADHAIRGQGGTIRIETGVQGSDAVARVIDDGPGLQPEIAAKVFDPFFTTKAGEGTGLGLSIVREIARRHGGSARVDSVPGNGACFEVRLPLATPEPEPGWSVPRS